MVEKKKIWNYFTDSVDYPSEVTHNILPYNTVWCYVSATFLNGFINYVKPISCFVIDRYTPQDEEMYDKNVNVQKVGEFQKWFYFKGTKKELIESIQSNKIEMCHTDLNCFHDDVVILSKIPTNDEDEIEMNRYMFFWFDMDSSDCCIGRFCTEDSTEDVKQSIVNWLNEEKENNKNREILPNMDNGIIDFHELPISFIKGWVSF